MLQSPTFSASSNSDRYLALVCIMGEDSPKEKRSLIDYNVGVFKDALGKVWQW